MLLGPKRRVAKIFKQMGKLLSEKLLNLGGCSSQAVGKSLSEQDAHGHAA